MRDPAAWIVPDWPAPPNVRAVVSTRHVAGESRPPYDRFNLGLRSGEDISLVNANRDLLERELRLPSSPRWLQQVHGDRSLRVTEEIFDDEQQADAAFTTRADVVLAILTADCLPILLAAVDGSEVAAVHAGWRGLSAGIIESTLARLRTPRAKLLAWLGAAIGPASYEVGDEVRDAFVRHSGDASNAFVATHPGHWRFDLYALARQRLAALGIRKTYGGHFDTFADARFYSYRRDGKHSGRFASLIWRQD